MTDRALTPEAARKMRERRAEGVAQLDLAEEFGVSQSLVSVVITGRRYADAGGPIERGRRYARRR